MSFNPLSYESLFIDEKALKQASIINQNVDMQLLTPTIVLVQNNYILRYLGTGLYVDLQNKIAGVFADGTSGNTLNANDTFLLNAYIQPMMIWAIMRELPYVTSYKFMNKGVQKMSSDNSQSASIQEMQALMDKAGQNFDFYANQIVLYLQGNTSLYPQYMVVRNIDDVAPSVRGYTSTLYLGNGREGSEVCDPRFYYR